MPRAPRIDLADTVYHVINRRVGRMEMFSSENDYKVFEMLLEDCATIREMKILSYCLMPNHWHLVLQPIYDGHMSKTLHWLTTTHASRWHQNRKSVGEGALYQGRYKSFPVETNEYLLQLIRYVERNPLRAELVKKAEDWKYSSLYRRLSKKDSWLADTIIDLPKKYLAWVNEDSERDIETIRTSVNKGVPFGSDTWVFNTVEKMNLQNTVTKTGRPK